MRLNFDIETDGLLGADGDKTKLTKVHCLWVEDVDTGERWDYADQPGYRPMIEGLHRLEKADVLIGHNIETFDLPALRKVYPWFNPRGTVRDTLVLSRLIFSDMEEMDWELIERNPSFPQRHLGDHNLRAWGYRLGIHKGLFNNADTDWSKWSKEMHDYCGQDVTVQTALFKKIELERYSQQAVQLEHDFQDIIFQQVMHGFRFNREKAVELTSRLAQRRQDLNDELQRAFPARVEEMKTPEWYKVDIIHPFNSVLNYQVVAATKGEAMKLAAPKAKEYGVRKASLVAVPGPLKKRMIPFNPGSRDQIAERLMELGWAPAKFTETGKPQIDESVLDEVLAELNLPEAKLLGEYFLIQKRLGQISEGKNAWLQLERNGRIHGEVITNGAVTGRCTHYKPNVAQTPAVGVPYGAECRALFEADPGYVLLGCDASGLELRCLAHFMARYDGGEYAKVILEGDIHSVNQKAAGLDTRNQAKTFIYAFLYGAGDEKIGKVTGVKPEEIERFKTSRRQQWADVVKRLTKAGEAATDTRVGTIIKGGILKEEFLRKTPALAYLKAAILLTTLDQNPKGAWLRARVQKERAEAANLLRSAGHPVPSYKGYLVGLDGRKLRIRKAHAALNTLLQSAGALLVKQATVFLYRKCCDKGWVFGREYANLAHVHDELQIQVRPELSEDIGRMAVDSIREAGVHFNFRCPLSGEYKVGRNWAETH